MLSCQWNCVCFLALSLYICILQIGQVNWEQRTGNVRLRCGREFVLWAILLDTQAKLTD